MSLLAALGRRLSIVVFRMLGADPLEPVDQDPDVVREEACRLVSRDTSVCAPPGTNPPPTDSGGGGSSLDLLGLLLWGVFIVVIVVLLAYLIRLMIERSGGRTKRKKNADTDDTDDEVEEAAVAIDRSREPTNWRAEAEEHRRAGRYREAMRCRYRALVGDLARRGLIDEIPGRTTGEERTQLRKVEPNAGSPFTSAADLFDGAWYGHHEVGADDDERFQSFESEVLSRTVLSKTVRK